MRNPFARLVERTRESVRAAADTAVRAVQRATQTAISGLGAVANVVRGRGGETLIEDVETTIAGVTWDIVEAEEQGIAEIREREQEAEQAIRDEEDEYLGYQREVWNYLEWDVDLDTAEALVERGIYPLESRDGTRRRQHATLQSALSYIELIPQGYVTGLYFDGTFWYVSVYGDKGE